MHDFKSIKPPKNHTLELTYYENDKPIYVVTKNQLTDKYFLYKVNKDLSLEKLKTSANPCFKEVGN